MLDRTTPQAPGTGTQAATLSYAPPTTDAAPLFRAAGDRYEIGPEIARGGMGAVHRGKDAAFGREVAIKLLLDGQGADSPAAARFFDEARISGQLQHPGIPPIYDVGTLPDGRPFLAMKLIKGKTLDRALKDGDVLNVPAVFEGVCQAVGYAHSRGVIHRDLKPQNVMVGAFAEVQVMDWGLAKILDPLSRETESNADTASAIIFSPRGDGTRAGAVMGSPQYMPPEQARGLTDEIDQRSDVFGLGGILCALLTDQPVYVGDGQHDTLVMAEQVDTRAAFERLDGIGVDPELVALCKRCLTAKRAARPADGNAVAAEVAALRAAADARARAAEQERAAAAARAAEERKRRRQWNVAAGLLAGVFAAGAGVSGWQAVRADTAAGLAATEAATARAAEEKAVLRERDAVAAREAAERMGGLVLRANNELIFDINKQLANRPGTTDARRELLRSARAGLTAFLNEAGADAARANSLVVHAHVNLSEVHLRLGDTTAAEAECRAAVALADRLAAADPTNWSARWDVAAARESLGNLLDSRGDRTGALAEYRAADQILRARAAAEPGFRKAARAVGVIGNKIGAILLDQKEYAAALEANRTALAALSAIAATDPRSDQADRDVAFAYRSIGDVHVVQKQYPEALSAFDKALAIDRQCVAASPDNSGAVRDLTLTLERIGNAHRRGERLDLALPILTEVRTLRERLAAGDPSSATYQMDLASCLNQLGQIYMFQTDYAAALAVGRQGLDIALKQAALDASSVPAQRRLLTAYNLLGRIAHKSGDFAAAADWYEKALAVAERFPKPDVFKDEMRMIRGYMTQVRAGPRPQVREPDPPPRRPMPR